MTSRFEIFETKLSGLKVLRRSYIGDQRGCFERIYCMFELQELLNGNSIVQINRSHTAKRGAVRGLHYQRPPNAEIKIVSCIKGAVFDVAVDLRRGSPTFMHWHGELLTSGNHRSLFIPEGFAHGFQALENDVEMLYFHTSKYEPCAEGGVNARDPLIKIHWPQLITDISARDFDMAFLSQDFTGLAI